MSTPPPDPSDARPAGPPPDQPPLDRPADPADTAPYPPVGTPGSGSTRDDLPRFAEPPPYDGPPTSFGEYGRPYGTPAAGAGSNGLGTAALVLGILAVLFGVVLVGAVFGAAAVALGVVGRRRARRGRATNGGVALTGALLGVVGIVLSAAIVVTMFVVFARPIADYRDCLSRVGSDRSGQQACADELRSRIEDRIRR